MRRFISKWYALAVARYCSGVHHQGTKEPLIISSRWVQRPVGCVEILKRCNVVFLFLPSLAKKKQMSGHLENVHALIILHLLEKPNTTWAILKMTVHEETKQTIVLSRDKMKNNTSCHTTNICEPAPVQSWSSMREMSDMFTQLDGQHQNT